MDTNNTNEAYAVITHLIDWSQAFDRQCQKLGINSFIENGVRKSLIPVLINYFQDSQMKVKWHEHFSSVRSMPGSGPQGCHLGQLEYSSQSNNSGQCVSSDKRYKFVDDMTLLEIINLITCGLSTYNFKNHVASDIAIWDHYLPSENCKSQNYLDSVQQWTDDKKMKLIKKKSKVIVFNYTKNYQFGTRLYLEDSVLDIVQETKLLGTVITSDLTWWQNTNYITQKGYKRLELLRKLYEFDIEIPDLVHIYTLYVRSTLEFNCSVWHHSINQGQIDDIERIQKIACRIILKDSYYSYENALKTLNLQNLSDRRDMLSLSFAKNCLKYDKIKDMFPVDNDRNVDKYKVHFASTGRLLNSAIPQMQRQLNSNDD